MHLRREEDDDCLQADAEGRGQSWYLDINLDINIIIDKPQPGKVPVQSQSNPKGKGNLASGLSLKSRPPTKVEHYHRNVLRV